MVSVAFRIVALSAVLLGGAAASAQAKPTIYFGGDILTMAGSMPAYAEAVVQDGERIKFVGSKAAALRKFPGALKIDLHGKTMIPGMIDSHVHWSQFTLLSALDKIDATQIRDADAYIAHLKDVAAKTPPGQWIVSYGYEKVMIPPFRNLTREDLDKASIDHPVFALYKNLHWGTANSAALAKLKLTKESPTDVPGGGVVFKDNKGEPTGLLTESAVFVIAPVVGTLVKPEQAAKLPFGIGNSISANGVTTIADLSSGSTNGVNEILDLQKLANDERFPLRLSATPMADVVPKMKGPIAWDGKFQANRCKLLADASLAGGTSATVKPQLNGSTGNLNYTAEEYQTAIRNCMDRGFSVATHIMGDRAHKVVLQAFENVRGKYDYRKMHNVIEHSAVIDPADLSRIKRLNMSVGFLTGFTNAYGDALGAQVLGDEMASRLFAIPLYNDAGINTALHSDGPIIDSKPLYLVWSAVNRVTVSGKVLGPQYREVPYAALLGVTRNAAIHLGLEQDIGSLGAGKMADFVILAQNPLKVAPMTIKDIAVIETVKGGKVFFRGKN